MLVKKILLLSLFCPFVIPLYANIQSARILLDGTFTDWETVPSLWSAGSEKETTFLEVKAANDNDFLFLYLNTAENFLLQNYNQVKLYVDNDHNYTTGRNINGIGYGIGTVLRSVRPVNGQLYLTVGLYSLEP